MAKMANKANVAEKKQKSKQSNKAKTKSEKPKTRFKNTTYKRKGTRRLYPGEGGQPGNKNAEKFDLEYAIKLGNELIEWLMPKYEGEAKGGVIKKKDVHFGNMYYMYFLLLNKGLNPNIISYLSNKFTEFKEIMEQAKAIQEVKLFNYATLSTKNVAGAIFSLKANHGKTDRPPENKSHDDEVDFSMIAEILKDRLPE